MTNLGTIEAINGGVVSAQRSLTNSGTILVGLNSRLSATMVSPSAFTNTGTVDLNGALILDYTTTSPRATLAAQVKTGYASGSWNGIGINSHNAAAAFGTAHPTAIGYADASIIGVSTFAGQAVDQTTLLMRYTFCGDADLNGTVNSIDFNRLATSFNQSGKDWYDGDFNYDGTVNALDFNYMASNFGQTIAAPALGSVVPEPLSITTAILSVCAARRRRRVASVAAPPIC
jgi:hypothetical protein